MPFFDALRGLYTTKKQWRQSDLAAALGVEQSTLSRWMNGGTAIPKSQFEAICQILDVQGDERSWLWLMACITSSRDEVKEYIRRLEQQITTESQCDERLEKSVQFLNEMRERRKNGGLPRLAFGPEASKRLDDAKRTDEETRR